MRARHVPSLASSHDQPGQRPTPPCDLDYLAHEGRDADPELVMSNSFGSAGSTRRSSSRERADEPQLLAAPSCRIVGTFALVFIGAGAVVVDAAKGGALG